MLVSTFRALRDELPANTMTISVIVIATLVVDFAGSYLAEASRDRARERAEAVAEAEAAELNAMPGRHPVPPMPGEAFEYTPRARQTVPSAVAADDETQEAPSA